ncbi:MAG: VWA domain-containing protein [Vicinamibacterales bacterium]
MRVPLRHLVATLVVIGASGLAWSPASARQQQAPTFRAGVTLVGVDVTVLDKDGRPVTGLSADDFRITLNGKVQPVRTLSYVQVTEPAGGPKADHATDGRATGHVVASNAIPADDAKIFILAVDDLSFAAEDGRRLLAAARTFVAGRPANELVGLATTSGSVAVNPTYDRAAVMAALRRVVGAFIDPRRSVPSESPLIGIGEALEIAVYNNTSALDTAITRECLDGGRALQTGEYGAASNAIGNYNSKCAADVATAARLMTALAQGLARQQVAALAGVLDAMKDAPGLKQMIVLTQGVAGTRNLDSVFEPMTAAAAAAGVQVSILTEDDEGVDLSSQDRGVNGLAQSVGGSSLSDRRREDRRMFTIALQTLADMSGGTFERVIADGDNAFARAAVAGSAVYRLGVEAPPNARASQAFAVGAEVARDGVTLRVNRHTFVPGESAATAPAAKVAAAIRNGTPYYGVPVRMGVARRRAAGDGGQVELELDVDVPASVPGPLKVTIGVLDEGGALKQGTRTIPAPDGHADYRHTVTMPVSPGAYRIRVAAEDAAGNVGSVTTDVEARLTAMGPFTASDLLTWWKDASGRPQMLALDGIPAGVAALNAGIELYPVAGQAAPKDLTVRLSILAASAPAPVAEVDLTPRTDGLVRRAEAALPLANLPPGAYVLRATVRGEGAVLGEVTTSIRIASR